MYPDPLGSVEHHRLLEGPTSLGRRALLEEEEHSEAEVLRLQRVLSDQEEQPEGSVNHPLASLPLDSALPHLSCRLHRQVVDLAHSQQDPTPLLQHLVPPVSRRPPPLLAPLHLVLRPPLRQLQHQHSVLQPLENHLDQLSEHLRLVQRRWLPQLLEVQLLVAQLLVNQLSARQLLCLPPLHHQAGLVLSQVEERRHQALLQEGVEVPLEIVE